MGSDSCPCKSLIKRLTFWNICNVLTSDTARCDWCEFLVSGGHCMEHHQNTLCHISKNVWMLEVPPPAGPGLSPLGCARARALTVGIFCCLVLPQTVFVSSSCRLTEKSLSKIMGQGRFFAPLRATANSNRTSGWPGHWENPKPKFGSMLKFPWSGKSPEPQLGNMHKLTGFGKAPEPQLGNMHMSTVFGKMPEPQSGNTLTLPRVGKAPKLQLGKMLKLSWLDKAQEPQVGNMLTVPCPEWEKHRNPE